MRKESNKKAPAGKQEQECIHAIHQKTNTL